MTDEQKQNNILLDLTETEKIERLTHMVQAIYNISQDLKKISKRNIYALHQELLLEVGASLMRSVNSRIEQLNKIEKESRDNVDSNQWEQDKEILELVEALRE